MTALVRNWRDATVLRRADDWAVMLDDRPARTPAQQALATSHRRLADAVAQEWAEAPAEIRPQTMVMTGYLNAVIDRIAPRRAAWSAEIAKFARHDALCHRAEGPADLAARQVKGWDPILAWLETRYGATLKTGFGVTPIAQTPDALAKLAEALDALDADRVLAALKLGGVFKSVALTLACLEARVPVDEAHRLSRIDEDYQAERWGVDAEETRRVSRERDELANVARFLSLLD